MKTEPYKPIEKAVAFIVARLSSSRFPAKHFRQIGDRPLIKWITDRLKSCKEIDEIVIATVAEKINEPLREYAEKEELKFFWYEGEIDHVTTRLRKAAEAFNADICVLISGDCPLIYAPAIDTLISFIRENRDADVVAVEPFVKKTNNLEMKNRQGVNITDESEDVSITAQLQGVNVARKRAWQLADDLSDRPELKEHHFPVIGLYSERFNIKSCFLPENLYAPFYRLSVDTMADLEFHNRVYQELSIKHDCYELPEVLNFLKSNPKIAEINSHVHQRQLVEDIKKVLFIVDAGFSSGSVGFREDGVGFKEDGVGFKEDGVGFREDGVGSGVNYGYGHLMRSLEIAGQIVERLGYPVTFLVDDEHAASLVMENGFRVIRNSLVSSSEYIGFKYDFKCEIKCEIKQILYNLVILDIYAQRQIVSEWREKLNLVDTPVVVIDSVQPWTKNADLIVIPGVTLKETKSQKIIHGKDKIILRRDIIRAKSFSHNKEIDVIAYLHHADQRDLLRKFADKYNSADNNKLNIYITEQFESDFSEKLAKSRILLANFGYSFYEALALNTFPVSWSISNAHSNDALLFYQKMALPPAIINDENDLDTILYPLCYKYNNIVADRVPESDRVSESEIFEFKLIDGTPSIIKAISDIVNDFTNNLQ